MRVTVQKQRPRCDVLKPSKLNRFPCKYGESCYRTNPHHVLHCHSTSHVPKPKPKHMANGKNLKVLFHQTSPENVAKMMNWNIREIERWKRSQVGNLFGEGIYLATSIDNTRRKAQNRGVIFCGEFDLGVVKETMQLCPQSTTQSLEAAGVNTLFARKGLIWTPKGGAARPLGEDEYVITSQRQLQRGCIIPLDEKSAKRLHDAKQQQDLKNENGDDEAD